MERHFNFDDLKGVKMLSKRYAIQGSDYIYCEIDSVAEHNTMFDVPTRFGCLAICLIKKGCVSGEVDFETVDIKESSLIIFGGSNMVRFYAKDNASIPDNDVKADVLFISPQFLQDLNLDLNAIDLHSLFDERPSHVVSDLSHDDLEGISHMMQLLYINAKTKSETVFSKNIARSLMQAFIYVLLKARENRLSLSQSVPSPKQSRQHAYVQGFMRLLQLHHKHERSISFYADKLYISPKYLSHLIKESTGRSATEWIGDFVVQEAKNLLRYSNKNIQQVAYELNFSTQSSFGKYFKHITGMSPTDFQKK